MEISLEFYASLSEDRDISSGSRQLTLGRGATRMRLSDTYEKNLEGKCTNSYSETKD
jgi:hypothetical protein